MLRSGSVPHPPARQTHSTPEVERNRSAPKCQVRRDPFGQRVHQRNAPHGKNHAARLHKSLRPMPLASRSMYSGEPQKRHKPSPVRTNIEIVGSQQIPVLRVENFGISVGH